MARDTWSSFIPAPKHSSALPTLTTLAEPAKDHTL
jgi:hypothetical protein